MWQVYDVEMDDRAINSPEFSRICTEYTRRFPQFGIPTWQLYDLPAADAIRRVREALDGARAIACPPIPDDRLL